MKKIMEKYNHSFGYVKGYFVLCGLVGIGAIICGIIDLFSNGAQSETWWVYIVSGMIVSLIAIAIVYFTYKKCPEEQKNVVKLTFSMMAVGVGAAFVLTGWFAKLMLSIIGLGSGTGDNDGTSDVASDNANTSQPQQKVQVWRGDGFGKEYLKVSSDGERYFDPEDGEWHKIKK